MISDGSNGTINLTEQVEGSDSSKAVEVKDKASNESAPTFGGSSSPNSPKKSQAYYNS